MAQHTRCPITRNANANAKCMVRRCAIPFALRCGRTSWLLVILVLLVSRMTRDATNVLEYIAHSALRIKSVLNCHCGRLAVRSVIISIHPIIRIAVRFVAFCVGCTHTQNSIHRRYRHSEFNDLTKYCNRLWFLLGCQVLTFSTTRLHFQLILCLVFRYN